MLPLTRIRIGSTQFPLTRSSNLTEPTRLVERLARNQQVAGSSPAGGSIKSIIYGPTPSRVGFNWVQFAGVSESFGTTDLPSKCRSDQSGSPSGCPKEVDDVSRARGFASATALIRYAVEQELSERQVGLTGAEERIAGTLNQVRKDVFRVARAQQALLAYLDTLTKALLTCVPEPPADARPQAVARAKERYDRLLKSASRAMVGEIRVGNEGPSGGS